MNKKEVVTIGDIVLTRRSDHKYCLEFRDSKSVKGRFEIVLTAEQLAKMVTGAYAADVQATFRGVENIGKRRIRESRSIFCPMPYSSTEEYETWLQENYQEAGWEVDSYLGSQSSRERADGGYTLHFSVSRWEDE